MRGSEKGEVDRVKGGRIRAMRTLDAAGLKAAQMRALFNAPDRMEVQRLWKAALYA